MRIRNVLGLVFLCSVSAFAEDFNVEFTAGYWPLRPSGNVRSSSTVVDLHTDFGIEGWQHHGFFRAVMKPAIKHRINVEGVPYRFSGANIVTRPFRLGGRTYPVQDVITSKANVDYLFFGYQYDVLNSDRGHLGFGAGMSYFGATASARSDVLGTGSSEDRKIPMPLAGAEFRIFPVATSTAFNINADVKGMPFGSYGYYMQGNVNAGLAVTRYARVQIGFNYVDADVHEKDLSRGFRLRFAGPILSLQLHD